MKYSEELNEFDLKIIGECIPLLDGLDKNGLGFLKNYIEIKISCIEKEEKE